MFGLHFGAFVEDSIGRLVAHEAVPVACIVRKGASLTKIVTTGRHYGTGKHLLANSAYYGKAVTI